MKAFYMKTKEQILRYISQCTFSDCDWQKVLTYCRENFGGGKAHKAIRPLPNSFSTYDEFIDWIENGIGVGDIVRYGHTIGIIGAYTPGYARLAAYLSLDGELIDNTMEIVKTKIFEANEFEIAEMKRKLLCKGLEFSVSLSYCINAYRPQNGAVVRVTKDNEKTTAIFHYLDEEYIYFYAYVDGDKVIKNKKCNRGSIAMSAPTKMDERRLKVVLANNKLEWLPRYKTLRLVQFSRASKNGRYWYFGDKFSVCSDIDKYTMLHNERHKCGNYFVNYKEAILFAQKVLELRKEIIGAGD